MPKRNKPKWDKSQYGFEKQVPFGPGPPGKLDNFFFC